VTALAQEPVLLALARALEPASEPVPVLVQASALVRPAEALARATAAPRALAVPAQARVSALAQRLALAPLVSLPTVALPASALHDAARVSAWVCQRALALALLLAVVP
jgi:hypothetical protein